MIAHDATGYDAPADAASTRAPQTGRARGCPGALRRWSTAPTRPGTRPSAGGSARSDRPPHAPGGCRPAGIGRVGGREPHRPRRLRARRRLPTRRARPRRRTAGATRRAELGAGIGAWWRRWAAQASLSARGRRTVGDGDGGGGKLGRGGGQERVDETRPFAHPAQADSQTRARLTGPAAYSARSRQRCRVSHASAAPPAARVGRA